MPIYKANQKMKETPDVKRPYDVIQYGDLIKAGLLLL